MRHRIMNNTKKFGKFSSRYDISTNSFVFFTKQFCKKYKNATISVAYQTLKNVLLLGIKINNYFSYSFSCRLYLFIPILLWKFIEIGC